LIFMTLEIGKLICRSLPVFITTNKITECNETKSKKKNDMVTPVSQ
jgi:hypothetical protein